jgi:hypothetical protein
MSINARLSKLEQTIGAGNSGTANGCLVADRWHCDAEGGPVGLFRCELLEAQAGAARLPYLDPAAYHYTEAQLEAIAKEQRRLLILVCHEDRAMAGNQN